MLSRFFSKSALNVTSVTPTFSESTSTDYSVTQNDKHVSVSIRCKLKNTLAAENHREIITDMPLPISKVNFPVTVQGANGGNFGWLDTNGKLEVYTYTKIGTSNILIISFGYDIA